MTAAVAAYIKANRGQRIEEIGAGMKRPTSDLTLSITKLLATKKIKKTGNTSAAA